MWKSLVEESCKVKPIVTVFFSFSLYGETFCPFEVCNLVWNFLEQKLPKLGSRPSMIGF